MLKGLLVLLCALAATAPVAAAQDDEVFVDPGSPSGKEYAIPIDRAREQAGKSTKKRSGSQKAPLFGEGIGGNGDGGTPPASRRDPAAEAGVDRASKDAARSARIERRKSREAAARKAKAAAQAKTQEAAAGAGAREPELVRARTLRAQAAAPDGGIGVGAIIAAGLGVLLVGGLIGLWLRRRAMT